MARKLSINKILKKNVKRTAQVNRATAEVPASPRRSAVAGSAAAASPHRGLSDQTGLQLLKQLGELRVAARAGRLDRLVPGDHLEVGRARLGPLLGRDRQLRHGTARG